MSLQPASNSAQRILKSAASARSATFYEFGSFRIDALNRQLLRDGDVITLTPKAFETLLALVVNRNRVVPKEELMDRVWPDTAVEEGSLSQNIFTVRRALGDGIDGHDFIVTYPKRGYRFVAAVREIRGATIEESPASENEERAASGFPGIRLRPVLTGVLLLSIAGGTWILLISRDSVRLLPGTPSAPTLSFKQLTSRRGSVHDARFLHDGTAIVYIAKWDEAPPIFVLQRLGFVADVSPDGRRILFWDPTEDVTFVRTFDRPAVRLGEGQPAGFSPDGSVGAVDCPPFVETAHDFAPRTRHAQDASLLQHRDPPLGWLVSGRSPCPVCWKRDGQRARAAFHPGYRRRTSHAHRRRRCLSRCPVRQRNFA